MAGKKAFWDGSEGEEVIAVCSGCNREAEDGKGLCDTCGQVAIRPLLVGEGVSVRDGLTPIIQSRIPELEGTWLKLESAGETGSFKDRIMRVLVREAVESGNWLAVVASSGNAAISASFYCSRAGLALVVVVPATLSPVTLGLLSRFPILVIQHGAGPAESHALARELAEILDAPNLSSTFSSSGAEFGCRTLGHEIAYQLPDIEIGTISASISVGPVLLGTRNGLLEAGKPGAVMVAGQALGCSPIVRAFESDAVEVVPWIEPVTTAAASIADTLASYAGEGTFFLGELRNSGGFMAAADDETLAKIRRQLREVDGVDVELACCAAIYALTRSGRAGALSVAVLTGSGQRETLKDKESLEAQKHPEARAFAPASGDVNELVGEVLAWRKK